MNDLEKLLLAELQKNETSDFKIKSEPQKSSLAKHLLMTATILTIGYSTYFACQQLSETKYKTLAIPVAIWGACAASYATRKIKA